jgi:hypothetical protein
MHFKMCLLRYFVGNPNLELGDFYKHSFSLQDQRLFSVDLSEKCWTNGAGKEALELDIARRLFSARMASLGLEDPGEIRLSRSRRTEMVELHTPPDEQLWPESFERLDSFRYLLSLIPRAN